MADVVSRVRRSVLLPAHETLLKRRKVNRYVRFLEDSQWWTRERLLDFQWQELKTLLDHAYQHVPYWHDIFVGLKLQPSDIRRYSDFLALPITSKDTIRSHRARMRPAALRGGIWTKTTGGSTGEPLEFDYTPDSYDWRVACSRRGYTWAGLAPGERHVAIWGVALGEHPFYRDWKEALHRRLHGRLLVNAFDFDESQMARCLDLINRTRPPAIVGYTTPLYHFAKFVSRAGGLAHSPRSAISAAEKLLDYQRDSIQSALGCRVFDTYGSREFMLIAAECGKAPGLHISAENLLVEIVNDDGLPVAPGELGDIVITDLHNLGMPFIRYRIGDMAKAADEVCSCGRGLPKLQEIVGRRLDAIRVRDGRMIPGEFFPHLLKDFRWIKQFQVIQSELDRLQIKIVRNPESSAGVDVTPIEREITKAFGYQVQIDFEFVDEIPLTKTGKFRVTVSLLGQQ